MSYAAWSTAGMTLSVTISSVVTAIPGVEGIPTVSPGQKTQIDTTPISATASTSVVGLPSPGTMNFTLMYDPDDTTHQYLLASFNSAGNAAEVWTITCTNVGDSTLVFSGYISQMDFNFAKNAVASCNVSVALSTGITLTP
jgi:hypothetical protein